MAKHNDFGIEAEKIAADYLKAKNYNIIEKNWRVSPLEADIIAIYNNFLIIIEVKARKYIPDNFNEIVSIKKQKNLINLAEKYLEQKDLDYELRFDVIFVTKNNKKFNINHIENAFYSML